MKSGDSQEGIKTVLSFLGSLGGGEVGKGEGKGERIRDFCTARYGACPDELSGVEMTTGRGRWNDNTEVIFWVEMTMKKENKPKNS